MVDQDQVTMQTGRTVSVEEARRILEVDPIVERYGTWAVTEYGVECLTSRCSISKDELYERDWEKRLVSWDRGFWADPVDVQRALAAGREHFRRVARVPKATTNPLPAQERHKRRPSLSTALRFAVLKRDNYRCQLCGKTANEGVQLDIDHKIALANGGSNYMDNLWVLCSPCNHGKGVDDL